MKEFELKAECDARICEVDEESLKLLKRFKELESEYGKKCESLEELEGFRIRCGELEEKNEKVEEDFRVLTVEVGKKELELKAERDACIREVDKESLKLLERFKELEIEYGKKCESLEKELEGFRIRCGELEEKNEKVEEDFLVLTVEVGKKELELKAEGDARVREVNEHFLKLQKRFKELEGEYGKKCENLEKELEGFRIRCSELEEKNETVLEGFQVLTVEVEKKEIECGEQVKYLEVKLGELEFRKAAVQEELEKHKRSCCEMEWRITCLEGDLKVVYGREQRAQEKIAQLEVEMKRKEQEEQRKFVELKVENRDLECGNRRAENELADYKCRCGELEVRVLQLEEENSKLHDRDCSLQEKMAVEPKELLGDSYYEDPTKEESHRAVKHQNEVVDAFVDLESACHSPVRESTPTTRAAPLATGVPSESIGIVGEVDLITTEKDHVRQVIQKLLFKEEESSDRKNMPVKVNRAKSTENDVMLLDCDNEMEIVMPTLCHNVRTSGLEETYSDKKGPTSLKSVRMHSDLESAVEEIASSSEENITLSFTPKRKHPSKVTNDNDDDKVPLSKHKMKKLADVTDRPTLFPLQLSGNSPTNSSASDNVEESITPSRSGIISLRQCEEKKCREERSYHSHSIGENLFFMTDNVAFGTSKPSYHTPQNPALESHPEEDEADWVDSYSEGESCGFLVQESDGSESEGSSIDSYGDEAEIGLALNRLLDSIRKKKNTSKWEYEADMLSSFSKDPELCMKAVCALYRQQTSDEQSTKWSLYANNRGFNKFDALRGSVLAQFLTDGDPHGPVKKSLEELEKHDPRAPEYCSQLASRYSKQLFEIYRNKEDPYFLPC